MTEPWEDDDLDWLTPHETNDAEAWDRYWQDQISHEIGPEFFDMFCFDQILVDVF